MLLQILKSKIHCATVTEANLDYVGSITIDRKLMDACGLLPGEHVYIANKTNGERFETYVIEGPAGSGVVCLNGAAARRAQVGDVIIIMSYALLTPEEARSFRPTVIFPGKGNSLAPQEQTGKDVHCAQEKD